MWQGLIVRYRLGDPFSPLLRTAHLGRAMGPDAHCMLQNSAGHSPCKESSGQLSRRFAVPRSGPVCVWGGGGPLLHYSLPPIGPRVARVLTQNTGARRVPRKLALGRAFQLSTLCLIFFSPGHTILKVSGHVRAQIHGPAKRKCTLLLRNLLWVLHQLVDRLAKW